MLRSGKRTLVGGPALNKDLRCTRRGTLHVEARCIREIPMPQHADVLGDLASVRTEREREREREEGAFSRISAPSWDCEQS